MVANYSLPTYELHSSCGNLAGKIISLVANYVFVNFNLGNIKLRC